MKTVLLLDTETTGTDERAVCIEVAAVLYSVQYASVVAAYSSLIRADANPAEAVNRISPELVRTGSAAANVWNDVANLAGEAEAIVAHGVEFDRRFVPVDVYADHRSSIPWICSMEDLAWPRASSSRGLVAVALAHDVGVESAHRALADVMLLARLLTRVRDMGVDLESFLARGLRPKARFAVADRRFDPARNEVAHAHGFRWKAEERAWIRTMAIEDAGSLPFEVERC